MGILHYVKETKKKNSFLDLKAKMLSDVFFFNLDKTCCVSLTILQCSSKTHQD